MKFSRTKNQKRVFSLIGFGLVFFIVLFHFSCQSQKGTTNEITAITNVRIFNGENVIDEQTVVIHGAYIQSVGGEIPAGAVIIDGQGATLLPGLIDSHVHTNMDGLRDALKFGITTELEMNGHWSVKERKKISERRDIADLRTSGMGVTAQGGHPTQYMNAKNIFFRLFVRFFFPSVNTPDEARNLVRKEIAEGADYVKVFIEDGSCIGYSGLPTLSDDIVKAAIDEAHSHGKMTVVHATTAAAAQQAIDAGIDCLGHLFFDHIATPELIDDIASSGVFVIPTLVTLSTAFGNDASWLAADERVSSRLDKEWLESLSRSMNVYPQGKLEDAYTTVMALHDAGVDILAGSDVSEPMPMLGGLAHGASLHHELQLLVKAGFTPVEALRTATSVPARRFGLNDRGRIVTGARADLLLVKGDPTVDVSETLSTISVWRQGVQYEN